MRTYSIKELENFSGVKAHTIRIWEQRYDLLDPNRTHTGIRYYNDEDLKKMLAISVLSKSGYKISKLAKLTKADLNNELSKIENQSTVDDSTRFETYINALLTAGVQLNENEFIQTYEKAKNKYSTYEIYVNIVYPLLVKIGTMWGKDDINPLQEHFVSNIIRQKMLVEVNNLRIDDSADEIVLFLPEKETHEIGLLLSNFLIRESGIKTYYFGQQVPLANLVKFIEEKQIKKALGFIFFSQGSEKLNKMLALLSKKCPKTTFYWAGTRSAIMPLEINKNHTVIESIEDLITKIRKN